MRTLDCGSSWRRKSAPIFSAPVPPRACAVSTRPSAASGESAPSSSACAPLLYPAMPSIGR
ncbi:Uncharacterised protein [Bordetella pertussis]|nr:Uncharacterised protein [Bordetella pertussis]